MISLTVVTLVIAVASLADLIPRQPVAVAIPEPQPAVTLTALPTVPPTPGTTVVPTARPVFAPPGSGAYVMDPSYYSSATKAPTYVTGTGYVGGAADTASVSLPVGARIFAPFAGQVIVGSMVIDGVRHGSIRLDQPGACMYVMADGLKPEVKGQVAAGQTLATVQE